MSVEYKDKTETVVNKKTGEEKTVTKKEVIWHMPDGMPDKLEDCDPQTWDDDACMRLAGEILHGNAEELKSLYEDRKLRSWGRRAHDYKEMLALKDQNRRFIACEERMFRQDLLCATIDGDLVIEKCRREIYGEKWAEHPDFKSEQRPEKNGNETEKSTT